MLDLAYGNATTDIFAYLGAGIAQDATFILGDHGGEEGTVDLGDDYLAHLPVIDAAPPVDQPFEPGW